jgi:hypothetical protein
MSGNAKAFWRGFFLVFGAVGVVVVALLRLIRGNGAAPLRPPANAAKIEADAQAAIEKTRSEIHADSDQALADRFNALAAKQTKKVDE